MKILGILIKAKRNPPQSFPDAISFVFGSKKDHLPGENPPQAVRVIGFGMGGREEEGVPTTGYFPWRMMVVLAGMRKV